MVGSQSPDLLITDITSQPANNKVVKSHADNMNEWKLFHFRLPHTPNFGDRLNEPRYVWTDLNCSACGIDKWRSSNLCTFLLKISKYWRTKCWCKWVHGLISGPKFRTSLTSVRILGLKYWAKIEKSWLMWQVFGTQIIISRALLNG